MNFNLRNRLRSRWLPCSIGDIIYFIYEDDTPIDYTKVKYEHIHYKKRFKLDFFEVKQIRMTRSKDTSLLLNHETDYSTSGKSVRLSDIGVTAFFDKEDAYKKLSELVRENIEYTYPPKGKE